MRTARFFVAMVPVTFAFSSSLAFGEGAASAPAKASAAPAPQSAAAKAGAPTPPAAAAPAGARRVARAPRDKRVAKDPSRPAATFPGFRMLPDGGSRVFVQVSGKADVAESKAEGRLTYRMKGVQAIATNRFPLVTSFFATPVAKVQLVGQGNDLDMVIDLRERTDATYRVVEMDGGIVLQVDFPRGTVQPGPPAPSQGEAGGGRAARASGKRIQASQRDADDGVDFEP